MATHNAPPGQQPGPGLKRYYIVKADDQTVVRSVPVAVVAPAVDPAAPRVAEAAASPTQDDDRLPSARTVARLMRSAIRRNHRAR